jgi:hypothetical protein
LILTQKEQALPKFNPGEMLEEERQTFLSWKEKEAASIGWHEGELTFVGEIRNATLS